MSKLNDFLTKQKIDPRRLLVASKELETLQPADRAVILARRQAKEGEPSEALKQAAAQKRRSGRPVTRPLLDNALAGKTISPKARQRITRAVNAVLKQKQKSEVASTDLF